MKQLGYDLYQDFEGKTPNTPYDFRISPEGLEGEQGLNTKPKDSGAFRTKSMRQH